MTKSFAALALAALGAAAPIHAETLYVPVLAPVDAHGPLATQLWISNFDGVDRPYATAFAAADKEGVRPKSLEFTAPANRGVYLSGVAAEGETGLLAVEAGPELTVNAWVKSVRGKNEYYAGLSVISAETRVEAGETAYLNGVGRSGDGDVTQLALVNLGETAAQCQVDQVAADGALVRELGAIAVPALSLSRFEDALGLRGEAAATVRVACDQPYYALAARLDARTSEVSFVHPEAEMEADIATAPAPVAKAAKPRPGASGVVLFRQAGRFHTATPAHPKAILRIPTIKAFDAGRLSMELDVKAGPWNPRFPKGAHNLIFFHRGRFRSNTLANINAFGPGNNKAKSAQNINLPRTYNTSAQFGFRFVEGQTYHVTMIYDARNRAVSFSISQNGRVLKTGRYASTARHNRLAIPGSGLIAEFGNYNNQALPEVSSLGWSYSNLRVELLPAG